MHIHCIKSVHILSYSGQHMWRISLDSDWILRISPYSVRMWDNARKMRTRITPNTDTFYAVLAFKNNAPFISCISKINKTIIDNTEDLDVVMLMYNLIEYSKNYSKTPRSLWNCYRDRPNSGAVENINYSIKVLELQNKYYSKIRR